MIQVGVNGYGTIGKRVADAIRAQPDMAVAGVTKRRPNYEAQQAIHRGYDVYRVGDDADAFESVDVPVVGTLSDLLAASDVVVDATPAGVGATYRSTYADHRTPAIFQGGEDPDVAETSFNARSNFDRAEGADSVRVVSCNTTALCRLLTPLEERFGVSGARATVIRRGGDPSQHDRGPIDDIVPDPVTTPSHHGPDVRTVLPEVDVHTFGVTVPATIMHLHAVNVTLESAPTAAAVQSLLETESRIELIDDAFGADSCGQLRDFARDAGRPRGDIWENCVWTESIATRGRDLFLFQAINQESNVVPENIDAIRAVRGAAAPDRSRRRTNETLGVGFGQEPLEIPA